MPTVLLVIGGGVLGTLMRYGTALWVASYWPRQAYLATLLVNLAGCLAIGYLHGFFLARPELPPEWRAGLIIGMLGALTTFSSFSLDTLRLLDNGQVLTGLAYLLLSVLGGLLAVWCGLSLARV